MGASGSSRGRVIMTNADRIRGMSDEELSEFMAGCDAYHEHGTPMQWLPWLRQPAETEE